MAWAKLDDNFHSHQKVLKVGLAGSGLFARALSYCSDYETDGFVPKEWVDLHAANGNASLANELASAGLWETVEEGFQIRDFLQYNPSRAQLEESRKKEREKKQRQRESRSMSPGESPGDSGSGYGSGSES